MTDYHTIQDRLDTNLRRELLRYKKDFKATDTELAEGLVISRQTLFDFWNQKRKYKKNGFPRGLPIHGINFVSLWKHLTDPEHLQLTNIPPEIQRKRIENHQKELETILEISGYLSHIYMSDLEAYKSYHHRNEVYPWGVDIEEETNKWLIGYQQYEQKSVSHNVVLSKMKEKIIDFSISGNNLFSNHEIDRLYQALAHEEELFIKYPEYKEGLEILTMSVVNCSFKNLTFPLFESIHDHQLKEKITRIGKLTEKALRKHSGQLIFQSKKSNFKMPEMLQVRVQIEFSRSDSRPILSLCHISDNTHLENVFAALGKTFGSPSQLEFNTTFLETLGDQKNCLVETHGEFSDKSNPNIFLDSHGDRQYHSSWVDRNTIKSIVQSHLNSTRNWLINKISKCDQKNNQKNTFSIIESEGEYINYRSCCIEVNEIYEEIEKSKKALGGYKLAGVGVIENVTEVLEKIQKIEEKYAGFCFFDEHYQKILKHSEYTGYWMMARAFNIQGDQDKAEINLKKLKKLKNSSDYPLMGILYETESIINDFFYHSDRLFPKKHEHSNPAADRNLWMKKQEDWLEVLREYINPDKDTICRNSGGSLELDTYLVASEAFGRIGRLDMRFDGGKYSTISNAIDNLLSAAYCCARIGYKKRTAHWLVNASIAYSRIGEKKNAEQLLKLAELIITQSVNPPLDDDRMRSIDGEYHQSVFAELNFSRGIYERLINKDEKAANKYFCKALKGAIHLGFARVISGSLYGIAITLEQFKDTDNTNGFIKDFTEMFNDLIHSLGGTRVQLENLKQKLSDKKEIGDKLDIVIKNKIDVIDNLSQVKLDNTPVDIARLLSNQAISIWEDWYRKPDISRDLTKPISRDELQHPISLSMWDREFLASFNAS